MDMKIISIQGTVIDCPRPLRTGNNVVLSLRTYMTSTAFEPSPAKSSIEGENYKKPFMWAEGKETVDEQVYRERKQSLVQLFEAVNLKPVHSNPPVRTMVTHKNQRPHTKSAGDIRKVDMVKLKAVEIIGDDEDAEEVEVEGEELSDTQLSLIYTK
jgi:DNA repair protein RAD5